MIVKEEAEDKSRQPILHLVYILHFFPPFFLRPHLSSWVYSHRKVDVVLLQSTHLQCLPLREVALNWGLADKQGRHGDTVRGEMVGRAWK